MSTKFGAFRTTRVSFLTVPSRSKSLKRLQKEQSRRKRKLGVQQNSPITMHGRLVNTSSLRTQVGQIHHHQHHYLQQQHTHHADTSPEDLDQDEHLLEDDEDEFEVSATPPRIIRLNVGGCVFETTQNTLSRVPHSRLSVLTEADPHYLQDRQEFFFDRDPVIFRAVINYHRHGELHLPLHACGPLLETELAYWQVPTDLIEKCCWIHFMQLKSQKFSLLDFEEFFRESEWPSTSTRRLCCSTSKVWKFLNSPSSSRPAKAYGLLTAILVCLSIFSFVGETSDYFKSHVNKTIGNTTIQEERIWFGMEIIDYSCAVFFSIDMIARMIFAPNKYRFLLNVLTICEILSVLPFYVDFFMHNIAAQANTIAVVHMLRIFGLSRVVRLLRYYSGLQVLAYTLISSYKDLLLMCTFIGVATLFFSSLIYFVEDQTKFSSIPVAFWWSLITMTTVGYGDYVPQQPLGFVVGSMCALVGVLVIAFTVPILVNSFMLYYSHANSMYIPRHSHSETDEQTSESPARLKLKRSSASTRSPANHVRSRGDRSLSVTPSSESLHYRPAMSDAPRQSLTSAKL